MWMPRKSSRVCNDHFVSGKPTKENPDPELKLEYKKTLKPKRKLPKVRLEIPIKCPKRDKSNTLKIRYAKFVLPYKKALRTGCSF